MRLGELITQYRHDNGLSQREFARRADLSNSLISLIEKGYNSQTGKKMTQDIGTYKKIADAMGIGLQNLFETIGNDDSVYVNYFKYNRRVEQIPIVVPSTEKFVKLVNYMTEEEYQMVMAAFERAEQRMKEEEGGAE